MGQTSTLKFGETVFALGFEGGLPYKPAPASFALHAYDGARVIESTTLPLPVQVVARCSTPKASWLRFSPIVCVAIGALTSRFRSNGFIPRLETDQAYAVVGPQGTPPFWQVRPRSCRFSFGPIRWKPTVIGVDC